jgi:hypothetical protein
MHGQRNIKYYLNVCLQEQSISIKVSLGHPVSGHAVIKVPISYKKKSLSTAEQQPLNGIQEFLVCGWLT